MIFFEDSYYFKETTFVQLMSYSERKNTIKIDLMWEQLYLNKQQLVCIKNSNYLKLIE